MKDVLLNPALDRFAIYAIFASMALYTVAFLTFVWHLSRLSSTKVKLRKSAVSLERSALAITILAFLFHAAGVVMRGIAASRVPWANMYEFSISGALVIVGIFLAAWFIREIRVIAVFVTGFTLLVLGSATTLFYVEVKTLMPALQSVWLVIHVAVAVLATAFFNIAAALSVAYLLRNSTRLNKSKLAIAKLAKRVLSVFPDSKSLENIAYRFNVIGFILWTFTLVAGAIWAERILAQSPQSIRMLKYAFNAVDDGLVGQQIFAGEATRLAYGTDEAVEGRDAFLERRQPDWSAFPWHF